MMIALATLSSPALGAEELSVSGANQPPVESTMTVDLPTVLRLAGARNLDLELVRIAVDDARAHYDSALENFMPALVPTAKYLLHGGKDQAVDGSIVNASKHQEAVGAVAVLRVPLGESVFEVLQHRQLVRAATSDEVAQMQEVELTAAVAYLALVKANAEIALIEQAVVISKDYERQLDESVQIGIGFKGDAARVETQTRRLQVDLLRAYEEERLASNRLGRTLHMDPLVELVAADVDPLPLALVDPNVTVKYLVSAALGGRPELTHSSAMRRAADLARRDARYGPMIPTIDAEAATGMLGGGDDGNDRNGGGSHDFRVGLSWRIGPGGMFDRGRIDAAEAQSHRADIEDEKLRDEIARQVVDAFSRVHSLLDQLREAHLNVSSAEQTLRLTRGRKELGVGTVLEDIQAQQEVLRSRAELVAIVTQLNQAQFTLLQAAGSSITVQ